METIGSIICFQRALRQTAMVEYMSKSKYMHRGKLNPFDAYMAGCCIWHSPRQILILEKLLDKGRPEISEGVEMEAYEDMLDLVKHEATIKRKKYL